MTPRFKQKPDDADMPAKPVQPELKICKWVEGKLSLPRDVRSKWLTDEVRAPDWRTVLKEFDRVFGAEEASAAGAAPASTVAESEDFDWAKVFPGDKPTAEALLATDGSFKLSWDKDVELIWSEEKLYVHAVENINVDSTSPFLTYGAGTWLSAEKAKVYVKDFPEKCLPLELENGDASKVVIEDCYFERHSLTVPAKRVPVLSRRMDMIQT